MPVKAIGEYKFPSKSRQELYGDDQLVHVWWKGNLWFCAAGAFRAPKAMPWDDFWNAIVVPFMSGDPDFDANASYSWDIGGVPFTPDPAASLESLGVFHKCVIGMTKN